MENYSREYPMFSLCGLNCGLCPQYNTDGKSKCPGCGGPDFNLKHPSCAIISCNKKHDGVEFCYQCSTFPCTRYNSKKEADSFITYKNVISDFQKADIKGIDKYKKELNEKIEILEFLIKNYNDGRRKSFYCLAVNLLELEPLKEIIKEINETISCKNIEAGEKIEQIISLFKQKANEANIELKLRKKTT